VSPNDKPTELAPESSWATRLALLYFVLATAALVWPVYPWLGNRIEPRVLGLPFSLIWVLAIITSNFCVLVLLYRLRLIDDREVPAALTGAEETDASKR
jgi:hypothetical protein